MIDEVPPIWLLPGKNGSLHGPQNSHVCFSFLDLVRDFFSEGEGLIFWFLGWVCMNKGMGVYSHSRLCKKDVWVSHGQLFTGD